MRTVTSSAVALLLLVSLTAGARAETNFEEAGKHFAAAKQAFDAKHFRIAATEFQKAYEVTKDPLLLYNVGEAWEKAGEAKKAVASYRAYLRAQPKAQDRADVDKRVKAIVAKKYKIPSESAEGDDPQLAQGSPPPETRPPVAVATATSDPTGTASPMGTTPPATTPPAATGSPPPPPSGSPVTGSPPPTAPSPTHDNGMLVPDSMKESPAPPPAQVPATAAPAPEAPPPGFLDQRPPSKMRIIAWVGVAVTIAVLTAGAIFGLAAQSRADEITRRETFIDMNGQPKTFTTDEQTTYKNLRDEGNLYNGLAIGFFSVAAISAVATTVLFVVDYKRRSSPHAMRIDPTVGPRGGGLALTWSF